MKHPFDVPARLPPDVARVQAYWRGLLRGGATMPFWDDAKLSDLPDLKGRLFLIDVFQSPERFRFATVGHEIGGVELEGRFLDETDLRPPFEFLRAQASVAVETAEPTFFHVQGADGDQPRGRLILPMWGDGRTSMLLGVVDFG